MAANGIAKQWRQRTTANNVSKWGEVAENDSNRREKGQHLMPANVSKCHQMPANASKCQQMPANASKCQQMPSNVSKCQQIPAQ
eukprot:3051791-Rhodomonas_salina.1